MNRTRITIGNAQISLGMLIALSTLTTLWFQLTSLATGFPFGPLFSILDVLQMQAIFMLPPSMALVFLFIGQRRLAAYTSLLSAIPYFAIVLLFFPALLFLPTSIAGVLDFSFLVFSGAPFAYAAVTLTKIGISVRIPSEEHCHKQRLDAADHIGALIS